jgi:hypothetical protein
MRELKSQKALTQKRGCLDLINALCALINFISNSTISFESLLIHFASRAGIIKNPDGACSGSGTLKCDNQRQDGAAASSVFHSQKSETD